MTIYASPTTIWYHITASINENKIKDINIRFVNFVILALLKKSFRYLCHCDTICLFNYYSDIDGAIVNLFVIIPSQYENAKNVIISKIMNMKLQILMLALEVTWHVWCSSLINVTKWDSVQWREWLKQRCLQMWGMKFRGVTTMKRWVFWWGRLQGKFDRILILWIINDFIEIFGVKYNLVLY